MCFQVRFCLLLTSLRQPSNHSPCASVQLALDHVDGWERSSSFGEGVCFWLVEEEGGTGGRVCRFDSCLSHGFFTMKVSEVIRQYIRWFSAVSTLIIGMRIIKGSPILTCHAIIGEHILYLGNFGDFTNLFCIKFSMSAKHLILFHTVYSYSLTTSCLQCSTGWAHCCSYCISMVWLIYHRLIAPNR